MNDKVAIFGGTFDPIHLGHTQVARAAMDSIGAQRVVIVPARQSPLKGFLPHAGDADRLAMISLAIAAQQSFEVSDYELKRPAPSYSLDTVRYFAGRFGRDVELYWLIGADAAADLAHWYEVKQLIDECTICTMYRAGCDRPDFSRFADQWGPERVRKLQANVVQTPLIDISSTAIRQTVVEGGDLGKMVHPAVAEYIKMHKLYRTSSQSLFDQSPPQQ